jgi:hypothetical protein
MLLLLAIALSPALLAVGLTTARGDRSHAPKVVRSGPRELTVAKSNSEAIPTAPNAHPLDPVLKLARQALENFQANITDYTATLAATERVNGRLSPQNVMEIKVIDGDASDDAATTPPDRPLHAYVKFVEPSATAGQEVIYIAGENDNKLIAHKGGSFNFMRVNLKPTGMFAMQGTKYPIYDLGFAVLLQKLIAKGERDREVGDCIVQVVDDEMIGDRACRLIQVLHPDQKPEFDFHIAEIYFDTELLLPLKYASYLWPEKAGGEPPLEEEYIYTNVRINPGLTRDDFDPDNEAYNYP